MIKYICILFLLFSSVSLFAFPSNYDLNFERLYTKQPSPWSIKVNNTNFKVDTLSLKGKSTLYIYRCEKHKEIDNLFYSSGISISQDIPFYNYLTTDSSIVTIDFNAKNRSYDLSYIIFLGFDINENVILNDTIAIPSYNEWNNYKSSFSISEISLLNIELKVADAPKFSKEEFLNFWIDEIEISIDGVDIYNVKKKNENLCSFIETEIVILDEKDYLNQFDNYKYIGFGETIHGSETISEFVYDNIKKLILYKNVRLVMFELPTELVFLMNLYINNEIDKEFYDILYYPISSSPYALEDFLEWLRSYNSNSDEKVNIFGFDTSLNVSKQLSIYSYLNSLDIDDKIIDDLLMNVLLGSYNKANHVIKNNYSFFKSYLDEDKLLVLDFILQDLDLYNTSDMLYSKGLKFQSMRDSLMWESAKFGLEHYIGDDLDSKVVLTGHLAHLNKVSLPILKSKHPFGYYLNETFGDDYHLSAISVGSGDITNINERTGEDKITSFQPLSNKESSIEFCLNSLGEDLFYFNFKREELIINLRVNNNFYYQSVSNQDSNVFIKESKGFEMPNWWPTSSEEMFELYNSFSEKIKEKILEIWK